MNGAKPPKIVTAKLYATDKPDDRTETGKRSAIAAGAGPVRIAIKNPKVSCAAIRAPKVGCADRPYSTG
jgi:hypothetical protein